MNYESQKLLAEEFLKLHHGGKILLLKFMSN